VEENQAAKPLLSAIDFLRLLRLGYDRNSKLYHYNKD
jgi:hypothetical protein